MESVDIRKRVEVAEGRRKGRKTSHRGRGWRRKMKAGGLDVKGRGGNILSGAIICGEML